MNRLKNAQYIALGATALSVLGFLPIIPVRKAYKESGLY